MATPAPMGAFGSASKRFWWQLPLQAFLVGLLAAFIYGLALQPSLYSVDPPKFLDMYTEARWSASGSPHHHHAHYAVWWGLRALCGEDFWALELASVLPAALALGLLFVFLRSRLGAGPLAAALVTGAVAGSSPVWFFATTVEVHGVQLLLAVVSLFALSHAVHATGWAGRHGWVLLSAASLLLGHPLQALLLPFLALWCHLAWRREGRLGPRDWLGMGAVGAVLVAAALLRYVDVESRQGWSTGTLSAWAQFRQLDLTLESLWAHLVRANVLLWPLVVVYIASPARELGPRAWRVAAVLVLFLPLALFVAYVGIFEYGGYFIGLGAFAAACFGSPLFGWLGRRLPNLGSAGTLAAFVCALGTSVLAGGGLELWRGQNPTLLGDELMAVDFARSQLAPLDAVAVFEPRLAEILRMRSRHLSTPELDPLLAAMPEGTDSHLVEGYLERHRMRIERGGALWVFRWEVDPVDLHPRRSWLQERVWARAARCPEAREHRVGGLRILGPARGVLGDP